MKRSELAFSTLLVPLDALAIFGAFVLSYYTRVEAGTVPVSNVLPFARYVKISLLITLVWLVVLALFGLYRLRSTRRGLNEFSRIVGAISVGMMTVIALIFFLRENFFSRLVIVYAFIASILLVSLARSVVRFIQHRLFRYGIGVRRAVIVGTGRTALVLARELSQRRDRGYVILGFIKTDRGRPKGKLPAPVLGNLGDIEATVQRLRPDELLEAEPNLANGAKLELIQLAEDEHVDYRFSTNIAELSTSRVEVAAVAGIPLMTLQRTPLEGWGRITKRTVDLIVSLLAMPVVLLCWLVAAIAIKLDSPGPVIFKQVRVGKEGRQFTSYKFRSMVKDAERQLPKLRSRNEATGPVFKMKNDPRVTRVGKWLRRTSLDELPQFCNVLWGDMSLVGPRPPLPEEVARYNRQQRRRLAVKPGITGPWQISGRSDISFDEWVKLDLYYIQNWSLLLDLTILLKTTLVVFSRRGAY